MGKYFLLFFLILISCSDEEISSRSEVVDPRDFFCWELGTESLYALDTISFFGVPGSIQVDSVRWYLKEKLIALDSNANELRQAVIEKSISENPDSGFVVTGQYVLNQNRDEWIRTEENISVPQFLIPMTSGASFQASKYVDGFRFFDVKGERIQIFKDWGSIENVKFSGENSSEDYDELAVLYVDSDNQIERRRFEQVFKKDIGLNYSYKEFLDSQCIAQREGCEEISWRVKGEKGFIERKVFLSISK